MTSFSGPGRRCGWCGVGLRWWQINYCRICKRVLVFDLSSSPSHFMGRVDNASDARRRWL